jgi:hypothetical protein
MHPMCSSTSPKLNISKVLNDGHQFTSSIWVPLRFCSVLCCKLDITASQHTDALTSAIPNVCIGIWVSNSSIPMKLKEGVIAWSTKVNRVNPSETSTAERYSLSEYLLFSTHHPTSITLRWLHQSTEQMNKSVDIEFFEMNHQSTECMYWTAFQRWFISQLNGWTKV